MFTFRSFNFFTNSSLIYWNALHTSQLVKSSKEHISLLSNKKVLKKLGLPLPPKRPLNPYMRFTQEEREKLKESNPDLKVTDMCKIIAKQWSQCDPEKKKLFQKQYLSEMQHYILENNKYKHSFTPEQQQLIENTEKKIMRAAEHARIVEKKESLGQPKKPAIMFIKFIEDKKYTKSDKISRLEWLRTMATEWENLSEKEKEKYKEHAEIAMAKYKSDVQIWEENMLRQGHGDVVRKRELFNSKSPKKPPNTTTN